MARRVILQPAARDDLRRLYAFIRDERDSPIIALKYIRRIRDYCVGFGQFPHRGTVRDDLRPGLRLIGFERRVTIAFTISEDTVLIVRIFYGGRDVAALLDDEGGDQT